jgi:hypothetical protein
VKSKYTSGKSVGKNQTVPIGVDDPRLKPGKIGQTKARQGAEIDIVGLDGKALISGGRTLNNPAGRVPPVPPAFPSDIVIVRGGNKPPKTYPGGSGPVIIVPTDPTNVSVEWLNNDLVISFDWDYANDVNDSVSQFIVELTSGGVTKRSQSNIFKPNTTQTRQTVTVTKSIITSMFNVFRTSFSAVCVLTADPLNNVSNSICAASVPEYVLDLPVPVITVSSITNGYSVSYTTPTEDVFDAIEIVEYESTATSEPTGVTYTRTFFSALNPAVVITPNFNRRWVKARFSSDAGIYTAYSAAVAVIPTVVGSVDLVPPNEVSNITASWSGDNIVVDYKLPAQEAGSRIQIELESLNSLIGFFYRFPDGSGRDQTTTITKRDLLEQFGQHYSSFTGILHSIDSAGNRSDGVSFNVPLRTNPLDGVVPTFSITPLTNGYSVFANNYESTTGVTYMEVYAKHTPWLSDPTNDDDVVYAGANPAVIIDTEYTPVYIKVRYYDDFDNGSSYSNQSNNSTTPLDAGIVTSFENPITFGVNGVIYAGSNYNSGNRTLFKTGGIFAYDSDGVQTTQILSDADAGTPTFITQRAQIADWNITDTKIENDLSGTPTSYTGLSATGDYAFWAGSTVSGGNETSKFTVTPAGEVTAREITILGNGGTDPLITAGGLFTVNNDGSFTATSADIQGVIKANSGEFLGNVLIKSNGSLYSPKTTGTVPAPGVAGVIFDNDAISAFGNTSGSYTQMYSTPLADGTTFKTTAADIGGWKVNDSSISRTGSANISLNATAGNISVSSQNVSSYTSGINGPVVSTGSTPVDNINGTPVGAENVFWAGTGGATGTSNAFRVTLAGNLYASNAKITGTVSSVGALGTMTMDGEHGYMSLKTAGSNAPVSYLVPRNNNIYLTGPSTTEPWSTGKQIASSGPTNAPYISAGSSFKDYWNNTPVGGVGMFTGPWDYFTTGSSKPFITATTTGIQLSVSPGLGLLLDGGTTATGDKLTPAIPQGEPSMLFYTAKKNVAPYSPDTQYGAWASFTNKVIKLTADEFLFINVEGSETAASRRIIMKATDTIAYQMNSDGIKIQIDENTHQTFTNDSIKIHATSTVYQTLDSSGIKINATSDVWQRYDSSGIRLQSTDLVYQEFDSSKITLYSGSNRGASDSAYGYVSGSTSTAYSKIEVDSTGTKIYGMPWQGDIDISRYSTNYLNKPPMGPYARQRMIVEDPVNGYQKLGMAVYYVALSDYSGVPTNNTGVVGDLVVQW